MVLTKPSCSNHSINKHITSQFSIFQAETLHFNLHQITWWSRVYHQPEMLPGKYVNLLYPSLLPQFSLSTHHLHILFDQIQSRFLTLLLTQPVFFHFSVPLFSPPSLASLNPRADKVNCLSISSFNSPSLFLFSCLLYKLSSLCSPVQHLDTKVLLQKPPSSYVFLILKMLFNETS